MLALRELRGLVQAGVATAPRSSGKLAARLRELEVALDEHIRLENSVLFPRALVADTSQA